MLNVKYISLKHTLHMCICLYVPIKFKSGRKESAGITSEQLTWCLPIHTYFSGYV